MYQCVRLDNKFLTSVSSTVYLNLTKVPYMDALEKVNTHQHVVVISSLLHIDN